MAEFTRCEVWFAAGSRWCQPYDAVGLYRRLLVPYYRPAYFHDGPCTPICNPVLSVCCTVGLIQSIRPTTLVGLHRLLLYMFWFLITSR